MQHFSKNVRDDHAAVEVLEDVGNTLQKIKTLPFRYLQNQHFTWIRIQIETIERVIIERKNDESGFRLCIVGQNSVHKIDSTQNQGYQKLTACAVKPLEDV